ncbi:DUF521 domain-containing protein [Candidatus Sumerlaeota bacterium]|nr:DUF521 domain-containing protein [Candidatus Sumerlaeota bacterium]
MEFTEDQRAILKGSEGPEMALAMKTLVRYGESFNAPRLVPIKSAHLTGSFAITSYTHRILRIARKICKGGDQGQGSDDAESAPRI